MSRRTLFQLALFAAVFALSVSLQSLAAFSEPSSAPPAGNAYAPLTTSPTGETKPGNLNVHNGYMEAYSDSGSYGLLNYGGYGVFTNSPTYTSGTAYAGNFCTNGGKCLSGVSGGLGVNVYQCPKIYYSYGCYGWQNGCEGQLTTTGVCYACNTSTGQWYNQSCTYLGKI